MPGYGKFMKELVTKKRILEYETIEEPHSCSAIITNDSITKREDPRAFTIPCTIGMLQLAKALCDLGESINLIPYAIYKKLGLGEPKSTAMRLLMDDRSIKHPVGILYDILVKVDRFIFSADFVILDCEIDTEIPIILSIKQPSNIHVLSTEDVIAKAVAVVSHLMINNEPLESVVANYDESKVLGYEEVVAALS
ncbi:uncharacterized protein LOC125873820 [Solanum stenotomum]|uniref:uncharacterized protein LOC125873820 n=1 Tax=Solanum stenotomum TaxID=172797 RepID=UPI0020D1A9C5|nr:uncharacterized protein LOC125873820 [Solanum stenotomum]